MTALTVAEVVDVGGVVAGGESPCTDSPLARFLCDPSGSLQALPDWLMASGSALWWAWWPLLLVVALVVLLARALAARVRRRRREVEAAGARWWEIVPPRELPADGAVSLWRLLAGVLVTSRRGRVGLVLWASDRGRQVHAGLWAPGGMPAGSVVHAVSRAWPGSHLLPGCPLRLPDGGSVAAVEVVPSGGPWAPLLDHQTKHETRGTTGMVDEPLRAVLHGLRDAAEAGGFAAVQVIVSRTRRPGGHRVMDGVEAVLRALVRGVLGVIELFLRSGPSRPTTGSGSSSGAARYHEREDPVAAERRRATEAKRAAGPHLRATVRLIAAGGSGRSVRRRVRELAGELTALALDATAPRVRQVRRSAQVVEGFGHGRAFYASARELAAIWHLPGDTARYGFPAPTVDRRAPGAGLPRLDTRSDDGQADRRCQYRDSHRDSHLGGGGGDRHGPAHLRLATDRWGEDRWNDALSGDGSCGDEWWGDDWPVEDADGRLIAGSYRGDGDDVA